MRTLAIETATSACSVALFGDDGLIAYAHESVGRGHAERLIPMIAALPDRGRADRILVDVGPGSFTGIRVGLAAAKALALAWRADAVGFSSTALIAARARAEDEGADGLAVVLMGGHGEVFVQSFDGSVMPLAPLASLSPQRARDAIGTLPAFGSGTTALGRGREIEPDARDVVLLPDAMRALDLRPIYGRGPDARLPA